MSSEIQSYTKVNSIHKTIVPGPNLGLIALIKRAVLAYPRLGTELYSARRPRCICLISSTGDVTFDRVPRTTGNEGGYIVQRSNPAKLEEKRAFGAKRGKLF